jgi:MoaA/NifB/PqqE/SkfB family radical SAM enzyme
VTNSTLSIQQPKYGFYDRLSAIFPSQIIVDVTEICNLACIHCPHPQFKESEYYSAKLLSLELNKKMVEEVQQFGQSVTQYIRYTSEGEPLTNPDIYDMIAYAKKQSGVPVTLTTNGTLMTQSCIEKLLASGVDVIDVSIDAFSPDVYSKIRVNGNLVITRSNVLKLIKEIKESSLSTKIVVSYVEQPLNSHETDDFEKFWKDSGADYVVIRRLHSAAGANETIAKKMWEETASERRPCVYPWERIILNPRGYLAFCPADWTHGSSVVDYRTTTIYETWQGEFYKNLREAHICNNFDNHKFCGQCPDWQATRWPNQGRSYADMIEEFKDLE